MEETFHLGLKALIRNKEGKILILKANVEAYPGKIEPHWDLPGGRIQKGEKIEDALKREVNEEIGINDLEIGQLLDTSISKHRITKLNIGLILFTYLCSTNNPDNVKIIDNEHSDYKWTTPQEAAELLSLKFSDSLVEKVKDLK